MSATSGDLDLVVDETRLARIGKVGSDLLGPNLTLELLGALVALVEADEFNGLHLVLELTTTMLAGGDGLGGEAKLAVKGHHLGLLGHVFLFVAERLTLLVLLLHPLLTLLLVLLVLLDVLA